MDTLLVGVDSPIGKLTPKQREFARQVALGETKAGAYRNTYKSKGKPHTVAVTAHKMSTRPDVQMTIEAYKAAHEAAKYRNPTQLRELVIHQLTQHALNDDCPPAQRIKALELLGKVSEVAAFTERKETTVVNQSKDIRANLLERLRNVVDVEAHEAEDDADSLLKELSGEPHPTATPLNNIEGTYNLLHTNPHEQSGPESNPHEQSPLDSEDPTPAHTEDPPLPFENEEGEGVYFSEIEPESDDESSKI